MQTPWMKPGSSALPVSFQKEQGEHVAHSERFGFGFIVSVKGAALVAHLVFMGSSSVCFIITWGVDTQIPGARPRAILSELQVWACTEGKY